MAGTRDDRIFLNCHTAVSGGGDCYQEVCGDRGGWLGVDPELQVINGLDQDLLLMDGEKLNGAMRNRIIQ